MTDRTDPPAPGNYAVHPGFWIKVAPSQWIRHRDGHPAVVRIVGDGSFVVHTPGRWEATGIDPHPERVMQYSPSEVRP